jgi:SAM-dependent methyltransferase
MEISPFFRKMELFYTIFPYPNRPFFVLPARDASILTHAGFAKLLSRNQKLDLCEALWQERRKIRNYKNQSFLKAHSAYGHLQELFETPPRLASVGCGTDETTLLHVLHPSSDLDSFDVSAKSLRKARWKAQFAGLVLRWKRSWTRSLATGKLLFRCGDATELLNQMPDNQFDHVQCFGVLHHQENPEKMLSAMQRALKTEGTLRLMVYSHYGRFAERGLQRRYRERWESSVTAQSWKTSVWAKWEAFKIVLWRLLQLLRPGGAIAGRFRYLGFSPSLVADALMHPCDPGLRLKNLLRMAQKASLIPVFAEAKQEEKGWTATFGEGQHTNSYLESLAHADERGLVESNIVLVLKKAK